MWWGRGGWWCGEMAGECLGSSRGDSDMAGGRGQSNQLGYMAGGAGGGVRVLCREGRERRKGKRGMNLWGVTYEPHGEARRGIGAGIQSNLLSKRRGFPLPINSSFVPIFPNSSHRPFYSLSFPRARLEAGSLSTPPSCAATLPSFLTPFLAFNSCPTPHHNNTITGHGPRSLPGAKIHSLLLSAV
ncbi:hypothetical protein BDQ17DRAFT_391286 [Cyathus striatus]|nr:hypothetical protein BDQ17DRAFT_391286 [Cyathus striatus]